MGDKKIISAVFTLTGSIIGAGILGLPAVFAESGILIGVAWLFIIGIIMLYLNLMVAEISLRTKSIHQLAGYAGVYLGTRGKRMMVFAMLFGIYSALVAYLTGEGESLGFFFPFISPVYLGIFFWAIMSLLLRRGLRGLRKIETYGALIIIFIISGMFLWYLPRIEISHLFFISFSHAIAPIGIVFFSLLGFTTIPEMRREIAGKEHYFKRAIIIGFSIPIALYILFSIIFIGVLGKTVSSVATLSLGPIVVFLGIWTMFTSYYLLSFSLKEMFSRDLYYSKTKTIFFTTFLPLIFYIIVTILNVPFSFILSLGGTVSAALTGVLIILIHKKSKKRTRNGSPPEILLFSNTLLLWAFIVLFIIIFYIQYS